MQPGGEALEDREPGARRQSRHRLIAPPRRVSAASILAAAAPSPRRARRRFREQGASVERGEKRRTRLAEAARDVPFGRRGSPFLAGGRRYILAATKRKPGRIEQTARPL